MRSIETQRLMREIRHLCTRGYREYDAGRFKQALRVFYQAWLALPKPQHEWAAAGWVLTAVGDTYYRLGQFEQGVEALRSALCCPEADTAPFTHLRLGQCCWELGRDADARTSLYRACRIAGPGILDPEPERYRQAIADLLPETDPL